MNRCSQNFAQQLGITDEAAEGILRDLGEDAQSGPDFISRVENAVASDEGRNRFLFNMANQRAKSDRLAFLRMAKRVLKGPFDNAYDNLKSRLVGSTKRGVNNMLSVESNAIFYKTMARESFMTPLIDLGYTPAQASKKLRDKTFQQNLFDEMFSLDSEKSLTGDTEAHAVAQSVRAQSLYMIGKLQQFGVPILPRGDYVMNQFHNPVVMAELGFRKWYDLISPLVKPLSSLPEKNEQIFRGIFNKIMTNKYIDGEVAADLAENIARPRIIEFLDGKKARLYYEKMGGSDYVDGIRFSMEKMADRLSVIESFGSKPEQTLNMILDYIQTQENLTPNQVAELRNYFDHVSGMSNVSGNPTVSNITQAIQAWTIVTKGGKAAITALNDSVNAAILLHDLGVPFFDAYKQTFKNTFLDRLDPQTRLQVSKYVHAGYEGMFGHSASRYMSHDLGIGTLNKMSTRFFDVVGLNWITDAQRFGYSRSVSMYLADLLGKNTSYNDLAPGLLRTLENYGIGSEEWAILRANSDLVTQGINGGTGVQMHLFPHLVKDLLGDRTLSRKLDMFFEREARFAIPEVGAHERALMNSNLITGQGLQRGTLPGEAAALFYSLRGVLMVHYTKLYPKYAEMGAPNFMKHLVPLIGMGYAVLMLKDLAAGKEPREFDKGTLIDSMAQSGVAGIVGDWVFEALHPDGMPLGNQIAGPAIGTVMDGFNMLQAMLDGETGNMISASRKMIPYGNAPFVEPAINRMLYYPMMEGFNPGFTDRYQNYLESQGSGMLFYQ